MRRAFKPFLNKCFIICARDYKKLLSDRLELSENLIKNVIPETAFSDHVRSGFFVPDQKKSRFLISCFNGIRSGYRQKLRNANTEFEKKTVFKPIFVFP